VLDSIGSLDIDLVVTDLKMMRRVRGLPGDCGSKTPAIALTVYVRAEDGQRAFAAWFQAHVTQPVDPDGLTDPRGESGGHPTGSGERAEG
jgi:CheY-like chemotaxis protein